VKEVEYTYLLAFVNISRAINSTLELQEVLKRIVQSTCETTGSKGCTLMLLDEEGERLEVKSSYGLTDHYVRKGPVSADKSISDTLQGKPVIIEDAVSDPRVQYPLEAKEEGIASIVSLPVILRDRVVGVLRLYTSTPCRFTRDDIDFLSAIAVQSGLAIDNAKVYGHAKMDYDKRKLHPSSTEEASR
jgi:GAF domain-containing protein